MTAADQQRRCAWSGTDPAYIAYHDVEWGVPTRDARRLFEFLILEGAQAGLSWSTILHKRDGYERCFAGFEPERVAEFGPDDVERCLADPGIVRNKAKVASAVGNARAWLELDDPVAFLWGFVDGAPVQNHWTQLGELPATTAASDAMSKALKRRGFRFVGPTICYSLMQACGLVNDHVTSCFRHAECAAGQRDPFMVGAVIIVVVLLLIPVLVLMSGGVASAVLGQTMEHDADVRYEGSELLDLDD